MGTSFFWVIPEILSKFPTRPGTAATYKSTESAEEGEGEGMEGGMRNTECGMLTTEYGMIV